MIAGISLSKISDPKALGRLSAKMILNTKGGIVSRIQLSQYFVLVDVSVAFCILFLRLVHK
jgi:hypothetical protein